MPGVRSPLARLILAVVGAAVATVFTFFRPQYHDPYPGRAIDLSGYPPPATGWTWAGGSPGYRFGQKEEDWNIARLRPNDLAPLRAAATGAGVSPSSVRPLEIERYGAGRTSMIVAGSDVQGRTCLGFAVPSRAPSFRCRSALSPNAAFLAIVPYSRRSRPDGVFISGIARGDVTRVVARQQGMRPMTIYEHRGAWGTFAVTVGGGPVRDADNNVIANPEGARLDFFAQSKRVASVSIRFRDARDELLAVAG